MFRKLTSVHIFKFTVILKDLLSQSFQIRVKILQLIYELFEYRILQLKIDILVRMLLQYVQKHLKQIIELFERNHLQILIKHILLYHQYIGVVNRHIHLHLF
mgnify:CR=1 FL=1